MDFQNYDSSLFSKDLVLRIKEWIVKENFVLWATEIFNGKAASDMKTSSEYIGVSSKYLSDFQKKVLGNKVCDKT